MAMHTEGHGVAERSIEQQPRDPLDLVFQLSNDLLLALDAEGRIVRVNTALLKATGYDEAELLGRHAVDFLHLADRSRAGHMLFRLRGMKPVRDLKLRIVSRGGACLATSWNAGPQGPGRFLALGAAESIEPCGTENTPEELDGAGYWLWDAVEQTLYASGDLCRQFEFGAGSGQCRWETLLECLHPLDRKRFELLVQATMEDARRHGFDMECRGSDSAGRERILRLSGVMHRNGSGQVQLVAGTVRDLTSRRESELWLRRAEDLTTAIFDNAGAAIVVLDREGRIFQFNSAAERLSGYSATEVQGQRIWELLFPPDQVQSLREGFDALVDGTVHRQETEGVWMTRQGEERILAFSRRTVRDPSGKTEYVVCIGVDVTGLKRTEGRLEETETRYERLIESAFDMALVQAGGRIVSINDTGVRLLRANRAEDLIGTPVLDLFPEKYHGLITDRIRRAIEEDLRAPLTEMQLIRCDGSLVDVEVVGAPTTYEGRPATQSVYRDITMRKQAEAALRSREHFFQTLAKVAPVGIFQTDTGGLFRYVNERWCEAMGLKAPAATGEGWMAAIHPDERKAVGEAWYGAIRQKRPFHGELRVRLSGGREAWVLAHATPETDMDGELLGYVGAIMDITRSKRDAEEVQKYRVKLEELVRERTTELSAVNQELEAFSYSVSHDLRAPLRAISGFSSVLREDYADRLDEQGRYFLRRIEANGKHMSDLIDNLLELSRVSRRQIERQALDLGRVAESVVAALRAGEPDRKVEVSIEPGLEAYGDPQLLQAVMQNLIGNAWKYTGRNSKARIVVGTRWLDGKRVYFVRDNGAGFDMACAGDLFGAFQRLHTRDEFEGTGVGLATVKRIVHRHGGQVWAEAEVDKGATFYFTLQGGEWEQSPEQLSLLGET